MSFLATNHPEVAQGITESVKDLDTAERRAQYAAGDFPRSDRVQDLDKRYRWDLFYLAMDMDKLPLLPDATKDSHIDTVLRQAVPTLVTP